MDDGSIKTDASQRTTDENIFAVAEDLAMSLHSHPTLSETIGEAAEIFLGSPTHILPGKI